MTTKKDDKASPQPKDVTGKELNQDELQDVAGGMRRTGAKPCDCQIENKSGNIYAINNPN